MKLSELLELVDEDNDGYLFFIINDVTYEIDDIVIDNEGVLLLGGYEK